MIQVHTFQIGSMRNFVYLLTSNDCKQAYVIDPQPDLTPWENILSDMGLVLHGVLLTHTHHDHVGGVPAILKKYPQVKIHAHSADLFRLEKVVHSHPDRFVSIEDGEKIALGNNVIEVWHTPGHSAGESCFLLRDQKPWRLLTGDTVFVGMVGRTDLETGDNTALFHTLERIKTLPPDTVFLPGHDYGPTPTSTLEQELKTSAAFQCRTVEELTAVP